MSHTTSLERRRRHPPWRFGSAGLGPSGGEPSPPHRSGKNTGKKPLAGGLAERVYRAVSPNVAGTPSACAVSERITGREQPVARARVFAKHPGQRPRTCRSRAPRLHPRAAVTRAAVREAIRDERRVDNERKRLFTTRSMARGRWLEAVHRRRAGRRAPTLQLARRSIDTTGDTRPRNGHTSTYDERSLLPSTDNLPGNRAESAPLGRRILAAAGALNYSGRSVGHHPRFPAAARAVRCNG